jgi:hypothetical protein
LLPPQSRVVRLGWPVVECSFILLATAQVSPRLGFELQQGACMRAIRKPERHKMKARNDSTNNLILLAEVNISDSKPFYTCDS